MGIGDREIDYKNRLIRAKAVYYANKWHLESIYPVDGLQAEIAQAINDQLHEDTSTKTLGSRHFVMVITYLILHY